MEQLFCPLFLQMVTMETAILIDAPLKTIWEIVTDTHCWPIWGPSVKAVRCKDRFIQPGTTGSVKTALGFWVPFEITDFVPGKKWSWRVANIPATGHRVEAISPERCRLIFEVVGIAAPYLLICKIAARRIKRIAESR